MKNRINRKWGWEVLKGIIAILLAVIVFINPAEALLTFATYLGILALIAGIVLIIMSLAKKSENWQIWLVEGIINAAIGFLIVVFPKITASLLIILIGLWITIFGIIQLTTWFRYREVLPSPQLLLVSSILSFLVGILLLFNPFEGAVLATVIIAIYALIYGISRFYMAWLLYRQ
jgi:uncharacterized membrane protein HdeD (DUF308 family)